MSTVRSLASVALAAFAALPACAGYRELSRELGEYQPTSFYAANTAPRAPAGVPPRPSEEEFDAQVKEIRESKSRWEKTLTEGAPEAAFYSPAPARVDALEKAGTDARAAEAALADGFTLEDLEVLAVFRNPAVRAAERSVRAALERYDQAWNLDEILRQYTAFTEGLMTGVGPMKGREPVQMRFPFPGVLSLKGQIVGKEVQAARETFEIARRTAVTGSRKAYWNLLFIRRAREITREMVGLLRNLEAVATTRYEAGKTSFQDVIKVRIQRETLEEDLRTLAQKEQTLKAKIRQVLNLAPSVRVGSPTAGEPERRVPDLEPLYGLALERKQELRRMRAMVGKMERMIEMAETRIYPAYSLNLSLYQDQAIGQVGTARMKEPFAVSTTASMGAGLPKMPWYGANDAFVRETRQKLGAVREELRKAEDATVFGVRDAWFRLDQAAREESLFAQAIVDLSQAALEVSARGYETGRVSFADVIASYTSWLKAHLTLARKRADLGVARAELEEAVGVGIQKSEFRSQK